MRLHALRTICSARTGAVLAAAGALLATPVAVTVLSRSSGPSVPAVTSVTVSAPDRGKVVSSRIAYVIRGSSTGVVRASQSLWLLHRGDRGLTVVRRVHVGTDGAWSVVDPADRTPGRRPPHLTSFLILAPTACEEHVTSHDLNGYDPTSGVDDIGELQRVGCRVVGRVPRGDDGRT